MLVPDLFPLWAWRCWSCGDHIEIAGAERPRDPRCFRCETEMQRTGKSDVLVLRGAYRSGDCRGCDSRITLVPIDQWQDFCPACRSSQRTAAAAHDWLPADTDRDRIADQLLSQAFGGPF